MQDNLLLVKVFIVVATLGLSIWAFVRQEYIIGAVGLVVFAVFVWFLFLRNMVNKEPLELHVMIEMSLAYLEDHFKLTPGKSRDFKLWQHEPSGKTDYKLVFQHHTDDGNVTYYPVTIDRFSGKFGEGTGTSTDKISNAEYFIKKSPGQPISRPVEIEDIQELFKNQRDSLNTPQQVPAQGAEQV